MNLLERFKAYLRREQLFDEQFNSLKVQKKYLKAISKKGKTK